MYSVYALVDPRDEAIRYIGMSKNVWRRYAMHLVMASRMTPEKDAWVKELNRLDLSPLLKILEIAETKEEARKRETHWIQHYLNIDAQLINMVNTGKPFPIRARIPPSLSEALTKQAMLTLEEVATAVGVA